MPDRPAAPAQILNARKGGKYERPHREKGQPLLCGCI